MVYVRQMFQGRHINDECVASSGGLRGINATDVYVIFLGFKPCQLNPSGRLNYVCDFMFVGCASLKRHLVDFSLGYVSEFIVRTSDHLIKELYFVGDVDHFPISNS
jgi:hypothetical protein